ncbi:fibronectin type III domain-containing protein, partial [bacterium]|nr:fibronectin type III domain-containing protein [bacterium]
MRPTTRVSSSGNCLPFALSSPILHALALAVALGAFAPHAAVAQEEGAVPPPAPVSDMAVSDTPNDAGEGLDISWRISADDERVDVLHGYRLMRSTGDSAFVDIVSLGPGSASFRDPNVHPNQSYRYQLVAFGPGGQGESSVTASTEPLAQWFRIDRLSILVLMLVVTIAIWLNILRAQSGKKLYIRKIAGMDAVQEAVGRATEMGQPVLYIAGIQDMDNVQTVAGLTILGSVSKMIAEYETSLLMPTSRSLVMSTARETVKESYLSAGRPDAFREDSIYYVTDEQFGFVAHVDGLMLRKKPATCFYFGAFFAESLILAETGNSIGAIQIAGTAMPTQLPFFVAACDYTLIGEELFAASAYLSQDDKMLGSLKGQDFGKAVAMV